MMYAQLYQKDNHYQVSLAISKRQKEMKTWPVQCSVVHGTRRHRILQLHYFGSINTVVGKRAASLSHLRSLFAS